MSLPTFPFNFIGSFLLDMILGHNIHVYGCLELFDFGCSFFILTLLTENGQLMIFVFFIAGT